MSESARKLPADAIDLLVVETPSQDGHVSENQRKIDDDLADDIASDAAVAETAQDSDWRESEPKSETPKRPSEPKRGLFEGREDVSEALGPWAQNAYARPGAADGRGPAGWTGAAELADALCRLAFGESAPPDTALRMIAGSFDSPVARRLLPECAALAKRGVRLSLLFGAEPRYPEDIDCIVEISRILGVPRLEDFLRIADFPGAELCLEQAMIGDLAYWTGEPVGRRNPTSLSAGTFFDIGGSAEAADAARLRFAAAWRMGAAPSERFCRLIAAGARV